MNYIKSLHIEGFKKFICLDIEFNEHMNILVGENEAGKSTILDAIKTVLNQQYRNADKSVLRDLFNTKMITNFQTNPSIKTLPRIYIELEMLLNKSQRSASYFYGESYGQKKSQEEKYGIRFECSYDEELGAGMEQFILDGKIPYEYYTLTWTTFANRPYQIIKRPLKFLSIDTTNNTSFTSFNYYNKTLFTNRYDEATRAKVKNEFRAKLEDALESTNLPTISKNRKFGIDSKKVVLETILSVYENSVALENRGSGTESLIKTEIALEKTNGLDVILMEEPENHLSFSTLRKMLQEISEKQKDSQIIVATHNNMIASRLNLKNVLWITENSVKSLSEVDKNVADFFVKADDNAFLQLLLSKKVFLVEGATEFLLLPHFYKQLTGKSVEEEGISVISCNGISYKKYLEIAKMTDKKIAVITDNDKKQKIIDFVKDFNSQNNLQHIFVSNSINEWTWEICIYNINKTILNEVITVEDGAEYLYHGKSYGSVLGKMLNNKVDVAYQMLISDKVFDIPQYVKDAIEWLKKIILAVAGAGKTYYICHKIDPQKRNLLLAFTRENVYNIQKELCNAYGCIPKLTTVSTFDAFTYHQLILPYEPSIAEYFGSSKFASCGISMLDPIPKTVKNNNGKTIPNPNYKNKNELRHYVTSRGQYYCANLSELVLKIKKEQNSLINRAIARLKMFYDSIFIDEFQDFREYDYDLIIALAQQYDDITLVGDYYQHSVSGTNNYGKPFKKKSIDVSYDEFVMELQNYGFEIDLNTLNKSIRCSPKVCEYINKKLGISISSCSKNTGSVIWANEKIYEILENQNIIKLVYNNAAKYSFQAMNWSYSKGDTYDEVCVILTDKFENITNDQFSTKGIPISTLNKLYVAMTRSRGNLYLIKASAFKNFKNPYLI